MDLIPGLPDDLARECLIRVPFGSFPSFSSVSKSWNTELRSPDFHRRRRLLSLTRPHFVLSLMAWPDPGPGNSNRSSDPSHWLLAFDPESESWTRLPPPPLLPFQRYWQFCRIIGVGPYIVVVTGGKISYGKIINVVHVFDLLTGQWRQGSEIPGPGRVKFGIASDPVTQTVLVAGGESESYTPLKSSLLYDVEKDTWTPLADMEKERSECDAVFLGGKFHVVNVIGSPEMRFPVCAESLDPDTWQWGTGDGRFLGIAAPDIYNRRWVTWKEEDDVVYCVRPSLGLGGKVKTRRCGWKRWREVADVPVELMKISCMMTWKGKLAVIGGPFSSEVMQHDAYVLDLKTYNWSQINLPQKDSSFADIVWCCGMDL